MNRAKVPVPPVPIVETAYPPIDTSTGSSEFPRPIKFESITVNDAGVEVGLSEVYGILPPPPSFISRQMRRIQTPVEPVMPVRVENRSELTPEEEERLARLIAKSKGLEPKPVETKSEVEYKDTEEK